MKYVCLIYLDEKNLDAWRGSPGELLDAGLRESASRPGRGVLAAAALEPATAAVTLRRRRGTVCMASGPFAATAEQLSGYVLIDADNLDEAIKLAACVPSARSGSIEVRPVREGP